jgi:hypothetical protein
MLNKKKGCGLESLYPPKLALTSPTGSGRSVGIVRLRTQAPEFFLWAGFAWLRIGVNSCERGNEPSGCLCSIWLTFIFWTRTYLLRIIFNPEDYIVHKCVYNGLNILLLSSANGEHRSFLSTSNRCHIKEKALTSIEVTHGINFNAVNGGTFVIQ